VSLATVCRDLIERMQNMSLASPLLILHELSVLRPGNPGLTFTLQILSITYNDGPTAAWHDLIVCFESPMISSLKRPPCHSTIPCR
jgi:hypothetical protein